MYSSAQLALKYINYWIHASNGKGHGVHSPFVFELITKVFNNRATDPSFKQIEAIRTALLSSGEILQVEDFGAGSATGLRKQRTVQQIAATSLKKPKYARLLYRLVEYFLPATVLELGTSLGTTTLYLAKAQGNRPVITLEGSVAIAEVARRNFDQLGLQNVQLIRGNFDETLVSVIQTQPQLDFVYIDGNHRKEPTLRYFDQLLSVSTTQSVFVFDDIHWSREMEEAWETIKAHPSVTLTIDLFFIGLVFFRPQQLQKEHFVIRF